jgi:hypothetical protein
MKPSTPAPQRPIHGPSGAWSLSVVIPIDAVGLYLTLAALDFIPHGWPTPRMSVWVTLGAAIALFSMARAIALLALRRLLNWRIASDSWSRIANSHRTRVR